MLLNYFMSSIRCRIHAAGPFPLNTIIVMCCETILNLINHNISMLTMLNLSQVQFFSRELTEFALLNCYISGAECMNDPQCDRPRNTYYV